MKKELRAELEADSSAELVALSSAVEVLGSFCARRQKPQTATTAVIWGQDRGKFGQPERQYRNKHICVTGPITLYHNQPDMILHSPKQVSKKYRGESVCAGVGRRDVL